MSERATGQYRTKPDGDGGHIIPAVHYYGESLLGMTPADFPDSDAVGRIRQSNESAEGPELSCALYCEPHGIAEARKLHEEAEKPGAGLVSSWEPQASGTAVARFDLLAPNPPGHIRFTRYPDSTEPCVVCAGPSNPQQEG